MQNEALESQRFAKRVVGSGVGYALVASFGALPFVGVREALAIPLVAAVALLNLWASSKGLAALLSSRALGPWGVFMFVKLSLTALVLYGLLRSGLVSPLPLVIGLGAVPVSLALAQLFAPTTVSTPSRPAP
jgi:hypothetical protein